MPSPGALHAITNGIWSNRLRDITVFKLSDKSFLIKISNPETRKRVLVCLRRSQLSLEFLDTARTRQFSRSSSLVRLLCYRLEIISIILFHYIYDRDWKKIEAKLFSLFLFNPSRAFCFNMLLLSIGLISSIEVNFVSGFR